MSVDCVLVCVGVLYVYMPCTMCMYYEWENMYMYILLSSDGEETSVSMIWSHDLVTWSGHMVMPCFDSPHNT